jgi:phage terminase large subunit-like protein
MTGRELRAALDTLGEEPRLEFLASLSDSETLALRYDWDFWARDNQRIPDGVWYLWKILAGRGFGKTRTGAETVIEWARTPGTRIALISRIPSDARRVMVQGESGIMTCSPPWFMPVYEPAKRLLTWPNGSLAEIYTSETPDDLRGPQFHKAWIDEWCKFRWPVEVWDMLVMCLRLGDTPQVVSTTTPRPIKLLREMLAQSTTRVSTGSTFDNAGNLPAMFLEQLRQRYEGTSLGQQELFAAILDNVAGALWSRTLLEECRLRAARDAAGLPVLPVLPKMVRTVLAIDPSVSDLKDERETDETGMMRVGLGEDGHGYVLDDFSKPGGVHLHAPFIVGLYREGLVDHVVAEKNNGGDLIEHTLRQTRDPKTGNPIGTNLAFQSVHASRGKRTRAEPVSMLFEQHRVHLVGQFAELEDQLATWVPDKGMKSPDRLDALVWACSNLFVTPEPTLRIRKLG